MKGFASWTAVWLLAATSIGAVHAQHPPQAPTKGEVEKKIDAAVQNGTALINNTLPLNETSSPSVARPNNATALSPWQRFRHWASGFMPSSSLSAVPGKRGLAVPWNAVGSDINAVPSGGKVTWMYNWESYLPPGGKQFEFVAMLRTGSADDLNRMNWNLAGSGAKVLLCLNEPDIASQANLSVDAAVKIWHEVCWPRRQALKLKLGAPAISNGPQGLPWLQKFIAKVNATHPPDFAPIHWYGVSANDFMNHVKQVNAATRLPIWVTEFASQQGTVAEQKTFMSTVLAFLDKASYVQRYAWFLFARSTNVGDASRLMTANGAWTDLMRLYLS